MPRERERESFVGSRQESFWGQGFAFQRIERLYVLGEKKKTKKKVSLGWKDIHEKGQNGAATTLGFPF